MEKQRPPIVTPKEIRPLPRAMWGANCDNCDKPHAKWEYTVFGNRTKQKRMCSKCMLYESKLGKSLAVGIEALIKEVEKELGTKFQKKDGKIVKVEDADRIFGAVVFANRVHAVRDVITLASLQAGRRG